MRVMPVPIKIIKMLRVKNMSYLELAVVVGQLIILVVLAGWIGCFLRKLFLGD